MIVFATPRTVTGKILGMPPVVGVGLISYSAYLWHQPLFAFAWHAGGAAPSVSMVALLSCLSLLLALITWKYVETPCRDRKQVSRRALLGFVIAGCAIFAAFGVAGIVSDGYAKRFASEEAFTYPKEAREEYVFGRMRPLNLRDFPQTDKVKALIVGDSFAGDFVNALYESGISPARMELSTREISKACGNLFLTLDFKDRILSSEKNNCLTNGWYEGEAMQALMKQADVVVLASSWLYWVAELLPESVENIERLTGKRVIVLGSKSFGSEGMMSSISRLPPEARRQASTAVLDATVRINAYMRRTLPSSKFIDMLDLICHSQVRCQTFTEGGELISFDGLHLTPEGARYVGQALKSHPIFVNLFDKK